VPPPTDATPPGPAVPVGRGTTTTATSLGLGRTPGTTALGHGLDDVTAAGAAVG
jgi:hypothetical protein